ncbi:hypothetical protein ACFCZT_20790 [Streptomyces sp. NPDC056230]|uniref:hypothetical protein n=1 Tax=Streptomyces sp. NPDC056230 TaxID=3345754 RepID=UPI0035DD9792
MMVTRRAAPVVPAASMVATAVVVVAAVVLASGVGGAAAAAGRVAPEGDAPGGVVPGGVVSGGGTSGGIAPEADVSLHGHVSLWGTGLGVWVQSRNRGPSNLSGVTVRVRTSVPLSGRQELSKGCLQSDRLTVLCRTGALRADAEEGRQLALELQLAGRPDEVVVRVDTLWNGGATDRNPKNNNHEVLALATGDEYVF